MSIQITNNKKLRYGLIGLWILNCIIVAGISIKEFWVPYMDAAVVSDPFDGTTMPIKYIPDWTKPAYQNKLIQFGDIPVSDLIPLPAYDINELQAPNTTKARTILKYTYTVVYMGGYEFDYKEYVWGHLAVDIRAPLGTPVLSVANGVVVKTVEADATGNKYIVVRHDNVPFEGKTQTVYSNYLHLSSIDITEGTKVKKGQMIGKVGSTGISTAPHLHFQIDRDDAPFHPYWHFTMADARSAGLSFFDAVTAGLWKDLALKYTIHPMKFVQWNITGSNSNGASVEEPKNPTTDYNKKLDDIVLYAPSNTPKTETPKSESYNPKLETLVNYNGSSNVTVAGNISTKKTDTPLTRADAVAKILDYFGIVGAETVSHYMDIPLSDTKLQKYAALAEKHNIVRGSYFYPDKTITRWEFIELVNRLGKLKKNPNGSAVYSDVDKNHSLYEALQNYAYTIGTKTGTFWVNTPLTESVANNLLGVIKK